jgi:ATP-dependent protease Clp ATPase subunit
MNKYYKQKEIYDYAMQQLNELVEHDSDYLQKDITEIHHELFNTDYYIIGRYQAKQWLSDKVFDVINTIKEYENDNFGEVNTDFSEPEKVVNMYVYIVGEYILNEMPTDIKLK